MKLFLNKDEQEETVDQEKLISEKNAKIRSVSKELNYWKKKTQEISFLREQLELRKFKRVRCWGDFYGSFQLGLKLFLKNPSAYNIAQDQLILPKPTSIRESFKTTFQQKVFVLKF